MSAVEVAVEGDLDLSTNNQRDSNTGWLNKMQFPSGMQLSSVQAREWIQSRRSKLKPWATFATTSNLKSPVTLKRWSLRLAKNVEYFHSNYFFVSIALIIYCLVTSPMLLLVLAALSGACYLASLRQAEQALVIAGKPVPLPHQYAALSIISAPVFFFAGAGTAIFWVIAASFIVVMCHASFYAIEEVVGDEEAPFDLQMEEV